MSILFSFLLAQARAAPCWQALEPAEARALRVSPGVAEWLGEDALRPRRLKVRFVAGYDASGMARVFAKAADGRDDARVISASERRVFLAIESTQAVVLNLLDRASVLRVEEDPRWQ